MAASNVILIGGAPFSGKTTLAKHRAAPRGSAPVARDDRGPAVRALTTPPSQPALHPMAGWESRAYDRVHAPALPIAHRRPEHDALWPAMATVIHAHRRWAGPVILEGWPRDPAPVASVTHPQLRAWWLLVHNAMWEAGLRADTAFSHGGTDGERCIRPSLARCRWASDRGRQAAVHAASVGLDGAPGETMDALVRRCVQHVWPAEASS